MQCQKLRVLSIEDRIALNEEAIFFWFHRVKGSVVRGFGVFFYFLLFFFWVLRSVGRWVSIGGMDPNMKGPPK